VDLAREKDIEQLRRIAQTQQMQIEHLLQVLAAQSKKIDQLTGNDGDLQQVLGLLEKMHDRAAAKTPNGSGEAKPRGGDRKPQRGHGPTQQLGLERVSQVFELDEADRTCPACGDRLDALEEQFETSEMVDVVEVRYRVVEVKRQKYACRCGACIETAPGPERALDGGRYSLGFAAKVAVDKQCDHLPLSRQVKIMRRHGLEVTSQTLWDQQWAMTELLRPNYDALYEQVMAQPVIGLDQTGWPRLEDNGGKPWQMWCLTAPGLVYHRICDDKSARTFGELVGNYQGTIVCDALATHAAGAREGPGITLAGCWAHVHRKYAEAEPDHPHARLMLDWIGELYALDGRAESESERAELRRTDAQAVLEQMKQWLVNEPALRTTALGRAMHYTLANWARLTRFVQDPRIPLDNNATERALRGPVVGRKNHYGSKSRRGTEAAAVLYTLIETAKVVGVDPARYLTEAATAAKRFGQVLLPADLV
jgi:transposase